MNDDDADVNLVSAGELDLEDAGILAQLRDVFELLDPVPDGLVDRIQLALELEDWDGRLTELELVSLVGATVRGAVETETNAPTATYTFASQGLTVVLRVAGIAGDRRLDGWVAPGRAYRVEIWQGADVCDALCDDSGRFVAAGLSSEATTVVIHNEEMHDGSFVTPEIDL